MSAMGRPLRVTHVITGLDTGGAEVLLATLVERLDPAEVTSTVLSLSVGGPVADRIERAEVPVEVLGLGVPPSPAGLARLRAAIRRSRPDVVQTWLLHSNVLGGVMARWSTDAPVLWGVHITAVTREVLGSVAVLTQRAERALARRVPTTIVACSNSADSELRRLGYPARKIVTIPNGFDVDRFHPDAADRAAVRDELGIGDDEVLVGHVGRFHPIKDHRTLLAAAAMVAEREPRVRFALAGPGVQASNSELGGWAAPLGDRVAMLGDRGDVARLYRAFDVLAISSNGEALPLVVGEAMASGVSVAATDCGDLPEVIGDTGFTAPVSDPAALADAIERIAGLPAADRLSLGERARARIAASYALGAMVGSYVEEWRAASRAQGRSANTHLSGSAGSGQAT